MTRPKDIGTAAETAVVRVLRRNGFPQAERRALAGQYDLGDITGIPSLVVEVKGGARAKDASDAQVTLWLAETERERVNASADFGVLVVQRRGIGPANAERWWAVMYAEDFASLAAPTTDHMHAHQRPVWMQLGDLCNVLRCAGYGDSLEPEHEQGDVPDDGTNDDPWEPSLLERLMVPLDPPQPVSLPCPGEPDCPLADSGHVHFEHP